MTEFLLGSNNIGILPATSKVFDVDAGMVPPSWLDSPLGVMLQGSASRITEYAHCLADTNPDNSL